MNSAGLQAILSPLIEPSYILQTRIHSLNTFPSKNIFIKREDELSSGITGSKYRKFASLIPFLKKHDYKEVILIGGAYSNNVIAGLQLLKENNITPVLFLLESNQSRPAGNELWLRMMLSGQEKLCWIKRIEWSGVDAMADEYCKSSKEKTFIIREGALVTEALPGAMTLALDILLNELEAGLRFNTIFVDSGTGASAIGLLLGLEWLGSIDRDIQITLIAGTEKEFMDKFAFFRKSLAGYLQLPDRELFRDLKFHKPVSSVSFGSINRTVLEATISIARTEGILMEPVYSVKHFLTMQSILQKEKSAGDALFIYNGGSLGLAGYQEKLRNLLPGL